MNILHISPYFPSLETNHAGGVCMGKEIEALMKNHKIYVLSFAASDFDKELVKRVKTNSIYEYVSVKKMTKGLHVLMEPFFPNLFAARSSIRFSIKLIKMVKKYHIDAIHAEYAAMGQYLWIKVLFPGIQFNLVEHDVTIQSYERKKETAKGCSHAYYQYQCHLIRFWERIFCQNADWLFTQNEKDRFIVRQVYKREDVLVINPYYGLDANALDTPPFGQKKASVCFMGQMGREENSIAAIRLIEIGKKIKNDIGDLEIYIIGNHPPDTLIRLSSEYIHVTGYVDNVDEYMRRCRLAVFPLTLGAGIKLKVLRSMALGIPVITGKLGAEGIDESGEVLILAETDEEITREIVSLLQDSQRCEEIGRRSRQYVLDKFSWEQSQRILDEVYK